MATGIAFPVEEYLRTSYEPDCDYADGELIQRNVGVCLGVRCLTSKPKTKQISLRRPILPMPHITLIRQIRQNHPAQFQNVQFPLFLIEQFAIRR